jgi:hypothetical protein
VEADSLIPGPYRIVSIEAMPDLADWVRQGSREFNPVFVATRWALTGCPGTWLVQNGETPGAIDDSPSRSLSTWM